MDNRREVREFLATRRAKITPQQRDGIANTAVGSLRAEAGRNPYDRALSDLVGELSMQSEEFRVRWAAHNVRYYSSGVKTFRHPLAGDLTLSYDALELGRV